MNEIVLFLPVFFGEDPLQDGVIHQNEISAFRDEVAGDRQLKPGDAGGDFRTDPQTLPIRCDRDTDFGYQFRPVIFAFGGLEFERECPEAAGSFVPCFRIVDFARLDFLIIQITGTHIPVVAAGV